MMVLRPAVGMVGESALRGCSLRDVVSVFICVSIGSYASCVVEESGELETVVLGIGDVTLAFQSPVRFSQATLATGWKWRGGIVEWE